MSRSKKIYILFAVLLIICLATFGVSRHEEQKEQIKNSDKIILELPSEDVTSLSWEYDSEEFAFHKDEKWKYDEDEAFPVDEEKILELLEQFQKFGVSFIIEEVKDYGQYGLDNPDCTIRIETAQDQYEILLGDYSEMDSERYVSIGDGNVYLVKNDPMESFRIGLKDLILHDEVPEFEQAMEIRFAGSEEYQVVYEEKNDASYSEEDVYFVEQKGDSLPLDTENVEDYLRAIEEISLKNYVSYDVSADELAEYGLDIPELKIEVRYTVRENENKGKETEEETGTFVLSIARDPEEKKKESSSKDKDADETEEEETEDITAYARVGDSQIIYKITGEEYKRLMTASYHELCHQEIVPVDFADIYQADIVLEGKKYTLTSKKKKKETIWYFHDEEVEIDDFKSALLALKASDFEEEQPGEKEEISLTLYLENDNYPEIQLKLYRHDGSSCIAVVDQEPVAHVERNDVVDLVEAVHEIVLD